jgi:hypothetical protein
MVCRVLGYGTSGDDFHGLLMALRTASLPSDIKPKIEHGETYNAEKQDEQYSGISS